MSKPSRRKRAQQPAPELPAGVPRSAAHFGLNLLGLAAGMGGILALIRWSAAIDAALGPLPWQMGTVSSNHLLVAMLGCALVFAVIGAGELLWRRCDLNPATGLAGKALRSPDYARVAVRLLGLLLTLGTIALAYWLLPEYHGSFYNPFWAFLQALAGPVALLVVPYFIWTDTHLADPHDSYWQLGRLPLLLVRGEGLDALDGAALRGHFMGWTVKAFFLPLMAVYLSGEVGSLANAYTAFAANPGAGWYQFLYDLSYMVDLLFCVVGYTITLRLFDSHIRSTEPTVFGWIIALLCYQPFYSVIGDFYLRYDDSIFWDNWLGSLPQLKTIWAGVIVLLLFVYGLSTVAFGLRFSNLTYRGVITSGPYRFTKHPAYLSKNLSWWLISVPWTWPASGHWYEALRNCCALGILNTVYFLRARTEERHLSLRDPDYVAYALWINQHGLLAWLGRLLPFLRYRPPAGSAAAAPVSPAQAGRAA